MSKVILYIAASLDGYIARPDGDISWLDPYSGEDHGYTEFFGRIGSVIVGANTYEQMLTFPEWPNAGKKTFVITRRRLSAPPGADIAFFDGDLTELVNDLRAASDQDIWLVGGSKLVASFMNAGLVDELMLFVIPVVLTAGIPLFTGISAETTLGVESSKRFSDGVVEIKGAFPC